MVNLAEEKTLNDDIIMAVRSSFEGGTQPLQRFVQSLQPAIKVHRVSSVYQVKTVERNWREEGDEYQSLMTCFHGASEWTAREVLQYLKEVEGDLQKDAAHKKFQVFLLAFGSKVVVSQSLHLPYPDFHTAPGFLMSAKEILPDYQHPVLHQTLSELSSQFIDDPWGKFYAQGRHLLEGEKS